MKVSELRAILTHLPDSAELRIASSLSGDDALCYLAVTRDTRWVMVGGPETESQPPSAEKVLWDTRPEPRLD